MSDDRGQGAVIVWEEEGDGGPMYSEEGNGSGSGLEDTIAPG